MYSSNLFKVHYFIEYIASFKMAYLKNTCIDKKEQLKNKFWNVISKYLKAWHQISKQLSHYLRFLLLILNRYLEYWIGLVCINSRIRKAHKHISWGKERPSYF